MIKAPSACNNKLWTNLSAQKAIIVFCDSYTSIALSDFP